MAEEAWTVDEGDGTADEGDGAADEVDWTADEEDWTADEEDWTADEEDGTADERGGGGGRRGGSFAGGRGRNLGIWKEGKRKVKYMMNKGVSRSTVSKRISLFGSLFGSLTFGRHRRLDEEEEEVEVEDVVVGVEVEEVEEERVVEEEEETTNLCHSAVVRGRGVVRRRRCSRLRTQTDRTTDAEQIE